MIYRILFLIIVAALFATASDRPVILGILEDQAGHYANEPNYRDVRVVFVKKGEIWKPFPNNCRDRECLWKITGSYPSEVVWTVAFDGKNLGQIISRTPNTFEWYADVGQQEIISKEQIPTVGVQSSEFGGYTGANVYRPLVANSQQYFKDPDKWKPFLTTPMMTQALQQSFRRMFPKLCHQSEIDQSKLEPLPYRNEDIKVVKSYVSISGWILAHLHLQAIDCEDVEAGFDIEDPWFVVNPKKSIIYLDSGMWLVDAGDYDHDGRSELVFSINRDNEGGYEIYYDDFKKHAIFQFNYH